METIELEQLDTVTGAAAHPHPHAPRAKPGFGRRLMGYGGTAMNIVNGVMMVYETGQMAYEAYQAYKHRNDKDPAPAKP